MIRVSARSGRVAFERSERKNRVFPRNDRPYGLKGNAFQTEGLLETRIVYVCAAVLALKMQFVRAVAVLPCKLSVSA